MITTASLIRHTELYPNGDPAQGGITLMRGQQVHVAAWLCEQLDPNTGQVLAREHRHCIIHDIGNVRYEEAGGFLLGPIRKAA